MTFLILFRRCTIAGKCVDSGTPCVFISVNDRIPYVMCTACDPRKVYAVIVSVHVQTQYNYHTDLPQIAYCSSSILLFFLLEGEGQEEGGGSSPYWQGINVARGWCTSYCTFTDVNVDERRVGSLLNRFAAPNDFIRRRAW